MSKNNISKKIVKYEFFQFRSGLGTTDSFTLKIEKPASIRFECYGITLGNTVTINNIYNLESMRAFIAGSAFYPWFLELNNNIDEVDTTNYQITLQPQLICNVICKYYS